MIQRDYILKQIQQLAQVLEYVLFAKSENRSEDAIQAINKALNELNGQHHRSFDELEFPEILKALESKGSFNSELAYIIADLLFEKATLLGNEQTTKQQKQALLLYMKAMKSNTAAFPIEATDKIALLKKGLSKDELAEVEELI